MQSIISRIIRLSPCNKGTDTQLPFLPVNMPDLIRSVLVTGNYGHYGHVQTELGRIIYAGSDLASRPIRFGSDLPKKAPIILCKTAQDAIWMTW